MSQDQKHKKEAQNLYNGIKDLKKMADDGIVGIFEGLKSYFEDPKDYIRARELTERLIAAHVKGNTSMMDSLKKDLEKLEEKTKPKED